MGKKLNITCGVLAGLVLIYTAGGFWALPKSANWALKKYVNPLIDREVSTEKVEFNPYTLHLNVKGLKVKNTSEEEPLLFINEIDTKLLWKSLFELAPIVQHFKVDQLQANVIRTGLSTFNFSDIIEKVSNLPSEPKPEEEKDKGPQLFAVNNFEIINSGIKLDDQFRKKTDEITELHFAVPQISNFESEVDNPITPNLSFKFDGEPLSIDANSLPFKISRKTGIDFAIKDLNIANIATFNPVPLNAQLIQGKMNAKLNLNFAQDDETTNEVKHLRLKGDVTLNDVVVQDVLGKPYDVVTLKKAEVSLKDFAYFAQELEIAEVKVHQPRVVVTRNQNSFNLVDLAQHIVKSTIPAASASEHSKNVEPKKANTPVEKKTAEQPSTVQQKPTAEPAEDVTSPAQQTEHRSQTETSAAPVAHSEPPVQEEKQAESPKEWKWNIGKISVENGTVDFNDNTVNFHKVISGINATINPINSTKGTVSNFDLGLGIIGGSIRAAGTLQLDPLIINFTEKTKGLQLAELRPYIVEYTNARIVHGQLTNEGKVSLNLAGNVPLVSFDGNVTLSEMNVTDAKGTPVARWQNLNVGNLEVNAGNEFSVSTGTIALTSPVINVIKNANGTINLQSLLKAGGSAGQPASDSDKKKVKDNGGKASSALPPIALNKINISNGSVNFKDNALNPPFNIKASQLKGTLTGFTTESTKPAEITLSGLLNGTPMQAKGSLSPFAKQLDLNLEGSVTSLSMPDFSPYSVEFTGYPIEKGQMSFNGSYKIDKNELTSTNVIKINKLEFGNESPDAKETLPVKLAVSLLQDRSGQIDLDIPVTGSLNDPEFSVGGIIVKVIMNLITKAVTAPFALIGSMFGGENMDISNLQFASGSSQLDEQTIKALQVLAKAMKERPGLSIQIMGIGNAAIDDEGLKERNLRRQMIYNIYRDTSSSVQAKKLSQTQINNAINALFSESEVSNKPDLKTIEEKKAFLLKNIRVPSQDLAALAAKRAERIRDYLINTEKIESNRLFIVKSDVDKDPSDKAGVKLDIQQ